MRALRIAIVGAGISGLVAARALQLRGFRVRVFEQSPELREVGAGLTVTPNATHALNSIGLGPELERFGMRPDRGGVKHWRTGETLVEIHRGNTMREKYGAAYYQVHRADLQEALAAAVLRDDPNAIVLDRKFVALVERGSGVELRFERGHAEVADVVVGADGLRSAVRTALFGPESPRFTGYIAWRGLVPTARLNRDSVNPTSCISLGPRRTFTRYLVRGGALLNYVALAERTDWQVEGWSVRADVSEVLAEFEGWYADLRAMIAATPQHVCYKWALFDREPLATWRKGAVTLLGDAAHPMLPFLGQGAAMGIEDAVVLARAFEAAESLPHALERYEAARLPRTTDVMLKSRETARAYHSANMDEYAGRQHVSAESLGLLDYNPVSVAV
jgi:salicylate hydroxylase